MNWEYLRSDEMKEAIEKSGGLCVLPLGCLEKHGPQAPLGTDFFIAKETVELAATMEEVVVFPAGAWLGDMVSLHGHPYATEVNHGCISLNPHTLLTLLEEICDEIARNGFRKILIVNAHGGNSALISYFLRYQGYKKKNYATMTTPVRDAEVVRDPYPYFAEHREEYPMLTDEDMEVLKGFYEDGGFGGGHADFTETARVMANHPETIAPDRYDLESGLSTHRADYITDLGVNIARSWGVNYPNAIHGKAAHGCSQTIGQALNLYCAKRLANIFKVLKEDEECVNIATGK